MMAARIRRGSGARGRRGDPNKEEDEDEDEEGLDDEDDGEDNEREAVDFAVRLDNFAALRTSSRLLG